MYKKQQTVIKIANNNRMKISTKYYNNLGMRDNN